jgi:hypothetical protein
VYQLSIYSNTTKEINPIFVKANGKLLTRYESKFKNIVDLDLKIELLKTLWYTEYRAQLIKTLETSMPWDQIDFNSQEDMMLFVLKLG